MADPHIIEDDPRLPALLQWRETLIESGAVSRSEFKEAHLRLVLRSGRTEVDQIRVMLPGAVAEQAGEMSRVLREAKDSDNLAVSRFTAIDSVPQSGFAAYAFEAAEHEPAAISLRRVRAPDSGADVLQVSWPPIGVDAGCVIYRLVSGENDRPYSPDHAHLVEVTAATAVTDARPLAEALRHLQVWANIGASAAEALAAQPILHAAGVVIGSLRDVEIREDSGRVVGQWTPLPGVSAVHVYRIPVELSERDGPAFRIAASEQNLAGFVDYGAERGRRYLYRLRCEVEVDDIVRLSEAVEREIEISALREPVTDMALTMHQQRDGALFDLEWTTPRFGHVWVFRTPAPPNADAHTTELDESVLEQVGLNRDSHLAHPVREQAGKSVMAGVPWPESWNRAYFTPATVLDGRVRLGRTISTVRTGFITDVALMEYCNTQVLTFDWPAGAASVSVYITPKDHDPRQGLSGRSYEITLDDYEKYGGMRFVGNLPNCGCALHLVPVAFSGGRRMSGVATSIEYGGLLRLWYDVQILPDPKGLPLAALLKIRSEQHATGSPPFVLVNNPDRIPLSANDGMPVNMFRADTQSAVESVSFKEFQWSALTPEGSEVWAGDVRGLHGWVRLFANLPTERLRLLALFDPPVEALRLTPRATPR